MTAALVRPICFCGWNSIDFKSATGRQPSVNVSVKESALVMTKMQAIEKLNDLVSRISTLETQPRFSEDFTKWQHDVRAVLKHVFPTEQEYVTEFNGIRYTLGGWSPATPESRFLEAFRSGLRSARAMLQSRMDEIDQFWPDGNSQDEQLTGPLHPELVFVIHGRQLLGEFHTFLRSLGLKPLEWSQARRLTGKPNPYTWEVVDKALSEAGAIVVLLTPDDEARLRPDLLAEQDNALEKEFLTQPRQNVLFEAGVSYGRAPNRTVLVRVGSHRPMSDLAGHHILQLDDSPQSRQAVADSLRVAGCPVDMTGLDWYQAGSFALQSVSQNRLKE
jgi:predicted nucleotide-binding protein